MNRLLNSLISVFHHAQPAQPLLNEPLRSKSALDYMHWDSVKCIITFLDAPSVNAWAQTNRYWKENLLTKQIKCEWSDAHQNASSILAAYVRDLVIKHHPLTGEQYKQLKIMESELRKKYFVNIFPSSYVRSFSNDSYCQPSWTFAEISSNMPCLHEMVQCGGLVQKEMQFAHIIQFPFLRTLIFTSCDLKGVDFSILRHMNTFRSLEFGGGCYSIDFSTLAQVPLQKLAITGRNRGAFDVDLAHLTAVTTLRSLDFSKNPFEGTGFSIFISLTNLQCLNLSGSTQMIGKNLAYLSGLIALEHLDLSGWKDDRGRNHGCWLMDEHMVHVTALSTLHYLNLSCSPRLTDTGLLSLSCLSALQQLDLSFNSWVTKRSLDILSLFPSLTTLNLDECKSVKGLAI